MVVWSEHANGHDLLLVGMTAYLDCGVTMSTSVSRPDHFPAGSNFFCPDGPCTLNRADIHNNSGTRVKETEESAMPPIATELASLRALTFRISSTPTAQLPQHVPAIAAALANCRTLLSTAQPSASKNSTSSEASVALHKYRTLLSSLLQDRTVQGRWSAIVLIKATVEAGGWETLQKCLPWVRGLLGILTKPDPPSSKKLCIITLTRIFLLTRALPTLVREITTPSLPTFIQACINIANSKSSPKLLQVVLESFNQLLPRYPTVFRSYLKQIHPLLASLIAPTPSSKLSQEQGPQHRYTPTSEVSAIARQLRVQLPCCAPKGTFSEDWGKGLKSAINNAHTTADKVFRAVIEDWQSFSRDASSLNGHSLNDEVQLLEQDSLGLPPWSGIFAGGERLKGLLNLVKEHLSCATATPVQLNISAIMDLVTRMFSLTLPGTSGKGFQNTVRLNNQVTKEERENLWFLLPEIHVATAELLSAVLDRIQACMLSVDALIIDQLIWLFNSEKDISQIRGACYTLIAKLLRQSGATLPKSTIDSLVPLIRACCEDLLITDANSNSAKQTHAPTKSNGSMQTQSLANIDTSIDSSQSFNASAAGVFEPKLAAFHLLPALLSNVRAQYFSDSLRARLDRTAILIQHKDAMTASVLNPPPSKKFGKPTASILPLLARAFPEDNSVESMLRPRMPVIRLTGQDLDSRDMNGDPEPEDEDSAESNEDADVQMHGEDIEENLDTLPTPDGHTEPAMRDLAMDDYPEVQTTEIASNQGGSSTIPQDQPPAMTGLYQSTDTPKRTLGDSAPIDSSSKRLKRSEEIQSSTSQSSLIVTTSMTPDQSIAPSSVPAVSTLTASTFTSTTSKGPEPIPSNSHDGESDDDDIGLLVLGPDTEDESE